MFPKIYCLFLLLLNCVLYSSTQCTTTQECRCMLSKPNSANQDIQTAIPWPADECNACQLLDIDSACENETSMDMHTFQFGFWVPFTHAINASTVAVIKIKNPGRDVKNGQFSIRGFDTPEMQGCGRSNFPASSAQDQKTWAFNSPTTTLWSWTNQHVYNKHLETACTPNSKIWFYNLHVLASKEEITNHANLTFEFSINGVVHAATTTQSLREAHMRSAVANYTTRGINQIHEIGDVPEILRILPVLFRISCSANESTCPEEWKWHSAAQFSSPHSTKKITSIIDAIQVTASASCEVALDITVEVGESVSFSTVGPECTVSILKLVLPCLPGKTFATEECENCQPGTYKSNAGSHPCTVCGEQSVSGIGAALCSPCGEFGRSNWFRTECTCEPGSYFEQFTWSCTQCSAGKSQEARARVSACFPCRAGTFSLRGASVCTDCQANAESLADRSACRCRIGFVADGDECTAVAQVVSQERISVPAGVHWVTFMHFSASAHNSVMTMMNTAISGAWRTGDVVTILRDGRLTRAVSYTRQANQWGDVAGFMLENHTLLNVYIIQTSQGVDLTNVAPEIPIAILNIPVGKTYMAWHNFPERTSINGLLVRTRDFGEGDRLEIKSTTSTLFSETFTKIDPGQSDDWRDNGRLRTFLHTRSNVYSFQIFGDLARRLFMPAITSRRLLAAPNRPILHRDTHVVMRRNSRQLLQNPSSFPDRVYYKNPLDCNTPPECRCKDQRTGANINWPGQECNACVMIGKSQFNCAGNDAYTTRPVQFGFWLDTSQANGAEVSIETIAVAKLKSTDLLVGGAPFPEMSIRQWGGPMCVGCQGVFPMIFWVSPLTPLVCLGCPETSKIYFFRLSLLTLNAEVRKISQIAQRRAPVVNFEFDIQNHIYVTRSNANVSEYTIQQGTTSSISTSYGITSDTNRFPPQYVIHKKLFEVGCTGDPTSVFRNDPCPFEGEMNAVLSLTADIRIPPGARRENDFVLQLPTGARQFKWTVRKVYKPESDDVFINLKPFSFQTCTAAAIYATWEWTLSNGMIERYSCDPACAVLGACPSVAYGDYHSGLGYDCADDIMKWSSLEMIQSDSLIIRKFTDNANTAEAVAYEELSCHSRDGFCLEIEDRTWMLSSQDDRLEIEYNTDGYECADNPNNIQIRFSNTLLGLPPATTQCAKGFTMTAAGRCAPCKENEYKTTPGNSRCLSCPQFSTSNPASTSDSDCICQQSYTKNNQGICLAAAQECLAGFSLLPDGTCGACLPGTFKAAPGSAACTVCPTNSVSIAASTSAAACTCSLGHTTNALGTCVVCLPGTYKPAPGSAACTACPVNSLSIAASTSADACICNQGYTKNGQGTCFVNAQECLAGFSPSPNGACGACLSGTFKAAPGSAACTVCPTNSVSIAASTSAAACTCKQGHTANAQGTCVVCSPGTYKTAPGPGACMVCPVNSLSIAASTSENDCLCSQGFRKNIAGSCVVITQQCALGFSPSLDGQCVACLPGTFKGELGSALCTSCSIHALSNPASTRESDCICNAGYRKNIQMLCVAVTQECPPGFSPSLDGACVACAPDTYKAEPGSALCTRCPANALSNSASTSPLDCRCNSGWTMSPNVLDQHCISVLAVPTTCSRGHTLLSGVCLACAVGKYKETETTAPCSECPEHTTTRTAGSIAFDSCICSPGHSKGATTVCRSCVAGKFKSSLGDGLCENCGAGQFSDLVAQISAAACKQCGAFSSSLAGSTKCTCTPGAEMIPRSMECTPCARGSYKTQSSDDRCIPCPLNSDTIAQGSIGSDMCICRADLGWSLKSGSDPRVCEQIVQELGGQFELAVVLSDFANNVNNVRTDFTASLAGAFGADPANITLVYYAAGSLDIVPGQQRRLLQSTTPATIVESKIRVFASTPRATAAEVTTRLLSSVPGIRINGLQTAPIVVPLVPGIIVIPPEPVTASTGDSDIIMYVAGGVGGLIIIAVCFLIVLRCGHSDDRGSEQDNRNEYSQDRNYRSVPEYNRYNA